MSAIEKVLPLLARSNDEIVRETLAYLSALLFNANKHVQVSNFSFVTNIAKQMSTMHLKLMTSLAKYLHFKL